MPEAEAELVEGWWTEYGGMRFGMLFMAEYIRTYAACFLFTHFFLGNDIYHSKASSAKFQFWAMHTYSFLEQL